MGVKDKIESLLKQLNAGIYEKEEVMALALLSSIAGESIFLLGPPGVAKSLIARRLKYAYKDAEVFEYLMSRFSTPDEIFGPVAISELKKDKYVRITDGYLPKAEVVFLDEIWKAGPSIQNALLTILNEKKFRNGEEEKDVPMKALISASNELPAKEQGLEALWDRFLVRLVVFNIKDWEKFNEMITKDSALFDEKSAEFKKWKTEIDQFAIPDDEYKKWNKEIDQIDIPENVRNVIGVIRNKIELHNHDIELYNQNERKEKEPVKELLYISDRRWRKIVRLLRASAFLNNREEVDLMDCFLIKHCIWNEEEQIQAVSGFVNDTIEEFGYTKEIDFTSINTELINFSNEINEETKFVKDTKVEVLEPVHDGYYEILNPSRSDNNLIKQSDFNNLSNQNNSINLYYYRTNYGQIDYNYNYNVRKGNSDISLFINDTEYNLKTMIQGDKRQLTKKPNPKLEEIWNKQVSDFLLHTGEMRNQVELYQNKDLVHLRTNLFVKPELANIVETHIAATMKDIEKLELRIREIQSGYKKLKDEEVVLDA
jgi:MoxR-like ATPase